jgi:hypothetical protein
LKPTPRRRTARLIVVAAIIAAIGFGVYLGYLALSNDSFPSQERPFGDYANLTSSSFNGTEFAFRIQWNNASFLPLYAQLTSPATDAANTPVCDLQLSAVAKGQTIFMPFTISPPSATVNNVDLAIAVKSVATGTEFTIVYNIPSASATNSPISPSNVSCRQPLGA